MQTSKKATSANQRAAAAASQPSSAASKAAAREQRRLKFMEDLIKADREGKDLPQALSHSVGRATSSATSDVTASPSIAPPEVKISRDAAEAFMDEFSLHTKCFSSPPEYADKLIKLVHCELGEYVQNPQLLLLPKGTIVDQDLVRKLLLDSDNSAVNNKITEEHEQLCMQLCLRGVMQAPYHWLPKHLHPIKRALIGAAMKDAIPRAYDRDPASIKYVLNELLHAKGHPAWPFDDLVEHPDPTVPSSGKSARVAIPECLVRLETRDPGLHIIVRSLVQIYVNKATKIPGMLKWSPV